MNRTLYKSFNFSKYNTQHLKINEKILIKHLTLRGCGTLLTKVCYYLWYIRSVDYHTYCIFKNKKYRLQMVNFKVITVMFTVYKYHWSEWFLICMHSCAVDIFNNSTDAHNLLAQYNVWNTRLERLFKSYFFWRYDNLQFDIFPCPLSLLFS